MRKHARDLGRALTALLAAVVLVCLSACAHIPTSGPVEQSKPDNAPQANNAPVNYFPREPTKGSKPEAIVEDFYTAGNSYKDDYTVAREYLAQDASTQWKPDAQTLVYRSAKAERGPGENSYFYVLDLAFSIDQQGILTPFPAGTQKKVPVTLTQVGGEWRISKVDDGTIIPEDVFHNLYQSFPIYFYDPGFTYVVPDARWFINRTTVTKSIVSAILSGPAAYLKQAVVSAFPAGARLAKESVPVDKGTAQVGLTNDLLNSSVTDRHRMMNQLNISLRSQPDIVTVQLRAGDTVLTMDDSDSVTPPISDKPVPPWMIAVVQGQLSTYDTSRNKADRIPGIDTSALNPRDPAAAVDDARYAFLSQDRGSLYYIAPQVPAKQLMSGQNLTRPTFDASGWVWTAPGNGSGEVDAFDAGHAGTGGPTAKVKLQTPWLQNLTVTDMQVSRDGTRMLVVATKGKDSLVMVSGIVRGADGTPRLLGAPLVLPGAGSVDQGAWASETTIVVADTNGGSQSPQIISLTRIQPWQTLGEVAGLTGIAAGNGPQDIYAQSKAGVLHTLGNSWSLKGADVLDARFPG